MENKNRTLQLKTDIVSSGGGSFNPSTDLTISHIANPISVNPTLFMNNSGITIIVQNMINTSVTNFATKTDISDVISKLSAETQARISGDASLKQEIMALSNNVTLLVESINATIADRTRQINELRTSLSELAIRVTNNEKSISDILKTISSINTTLNIFNTKITEIEKTLEKAVTDINNNKTDILKNNQEILNIKTDLSNKLDKNTFDLHLIDFNNEKGKLESVSTVVSDLKKTVDNHSIILDGTKKMSEIETDLNGMQTSLQAVSSKVDTFDDKIDSIETETQTIKDYIAEHDVDIKNIPAIAAQTDANKTDITTIFSAIGNPSPMSGGFLPWNYVKVINTTDMNSGWLDNIANQFAVGESTLDKSVLILINRINVHKASIDTIKTTIDEINTKIGKIETDVKTCLEAIEILPDINMSIQNIQAKVDQNITDIEELKKKTQYMNTDGDLPENRVHIDQTTVENWNEDTVGNPYNGSQIINKDVETSKYSLASVLMAFYYRLSYLKGIADSSDTASMLKKIEDLTTALEELKTAVETADEDILQKIDDLTDAEIASSNDPIILNKWGAAAEETYELEDASLFITGDDTLADVIKKIQNRLFQIKKLYNTYEKTGLPGEKIVTGADQNVINEGIDGETLEETDAKFIHFGDNLDKVVTAIKAHIDIAYEAIRSIKLKTDPITVQKQDGVTTLSIAGNLNVNNKLHVVGKATFEDQLVVDNILDTKELQVNGKKIFVDPTIVTPTVRENLTVLSNSNLTGVQVIDRSATAVTSSSTTLNAEPIVLGTHVGIANRSKKSYTVIENLDHVMINCYYSFYVDLSAVANNKLVFFDFIIKDIRSLVINESISKKFTSDKEQYTKWLDVNTTTDYSISHYGAAFGTADTNGRTDGVVISSTPKLMNVQLGNSVGAFNGETRFDTTQRLMTSQPNTKIIMSETDYSTYHVVVDGGYKTLMFYKSSISADDSKFFVNMVVRNKIFKKEWV